MGKRLHLLLVSAQENDRIEIPLIFKAEYEVTCVSNLQDAQRILQQTVNIVLLDMYLPNGDSLAVLQHIKTQPHLLSIPVIVLTASGDTETENNALTAHADEFISRPYHPQIIERRVANTIEKAHLQGLYSYNMQTGCILDHQELDLLTGIYNRRGFCMQTEMLIHTNREQLYVMICLDIDRFKIINDLFGREMGDTVLREIAEKLRRCMKGVGSYGRLVSDQFAVCFPVEYLSPADLLKQIGTNLQSLQVPYKMIIQAGIYRIDDIHLPVEQMCDRAQLALRTIKGDYTKQIAYYDTGLRETMVEEQELVSDMEAALKEKQFFIQIQPIYDLKKEQIISGEVLVRWNHPTKGLIPPGKFIPWFERNGLIMELDYYVWEEACKVLSHMREQGHKIVPLSVNVSRINLFAPDLPKRIRALIYKYDLPMDALKLEITESAYAEDKLHVLQSVYALRDCGFQILMDDFGSGYSSLSTLKDMPIDILKIDMSLVNDIDTSKKAGSVITSIVRMAKWLSLIVVTEGVERPEQAAYLRNIGCDRGQGFYYSRPLDVSAFLHNLWKSTQRHAIQTQPIFPAQLDFDFLQQETNADMKLFFNDLIGAVGIYRLRNGNLQVLQVSDQYYKLFENTPEELFGKNHDILRFTHVKDRVRLLHLCQYCMEKQKVGQMEIARKHKYGAWMSVGIKMKYIGKTTNADLFYIAMTDNTEYQMMRRMVTQTGK